MRVLRYLAVAFAASAVSFGIASGIGLASAAKYHRIRTRDAIVIHSLDLYCYVFGRDPDHHERGPLMICARSSTHTHGRTIAVSRYHFSISTANGRYVKYRTPRSP